MEPCCSPDAPDDERIRAIGQPYLIHYTRFQQLMGELCGLVDKNREAIHYRGIFSSSRNGKTSLAEALVAKFPPDLNVLGDAAIVPVVYLLLPGTSTVREFAIRILDGLQEVYNRRSSTTALLSAAYASLRAMQTRALLIDEFQHLNVGHWQARAGLTNTIKEIGEACDLSLFVFGVPNGIDLIENDPQLSGRFEYLPLPRWGYTEETLLLLATLESRLPLRRESSIASNEELVDEILRLSDGIIGHIRAIVEDCARTAIITGRERIDMETLRQRSWIAPVERKAHALRVIDPRPHELLPHAGR